MTWNLDELEEDAEYATVAVEEIERLQALTPKMKANPEPSMFPAMDALDAECWDDASPRQTAIIFLDVDGVLRNMGIPDEKEYEDTMLLGSSPLEQLRRIVTASGARLVLSSELRFDMYFVEGVSVAFENVGMRRPIGPTPHLQGVDRATEINTWLGCNPQLVDSVRWIAIDTRPLNPGIQDEHVVKIDGSQGLTQDCADEAIKKLNLN